MSAHRTLLLRSLNYSKAADFDVAHDFRGLVAWLEHTQVWCRASQHLCGSCS